MRSTEEAGGKLPSDDTMRGLQRTIKVMSRSYSRSCFVSFADESRFVKKRYNRLKFTSIVGLNFITDLSVREFLTGR
jgi:hypothetical protein